MYLYAMIMGGCDKPGGLETVPKKPPVERVESLGRSLTTERFEWYHGLTSSRPASSH